MAATRSRELLPNRRIGETFELEVAGLRYTVTIGRFPDGRVGEIFLNTDSNSATDTNAHHSATVCSIALQCGADKGALLGQPRPAKRPLRRSARPPLRAISMTTGNGSYRR
jgi:hypothetical protein